MGEKLLVMLDASAVGEAGCTLRLFNNVVMGYAPQYNRNDMEFGSAMHKFRKVFRDKGQQGIPEGLSEATKYFSTKVARIEKPYLTVDFLSRCCLAYAAKYAADDFEVLRFKEEPLTELRFCFPEPFYVDDFMEILIAGTMDEKGKFTYNVHPTVCDMKCTSLWNKQKMFDGYQLSSQLRFYGWMDRKYAQYFPDTWGTLWHEDMDYMIEGVFHKAGTKASPEALVEFERSPSIRYKPWELDEFEEMLKELVHGRIIPAIHHYVKDGKTPPRDGILVKACETVYGACKYAEACKMPDQESRKIILKTSFKQRNYNPLEHGD